MICVDSYEQRVLSGRYLNYGPEETEHTFHGVMQLLAGMEQILDDADYLQPTHAMHSFASKLSRAKEPQERLCRNGKTATFVVKILFRQHTSWQGSVTWLEENVEQPFRSVLELLLLIDSALNEAP